MRFDQQSSKLGLTYDDLHVDALDINDMVTGGDGAFCFFDEDEPLLITSTYYNAWYFINLENDDYSYENANSGVFINPSDYDSQNNVISHFSFWFMSSAIFFPSVEKYIQFFLRHWWGPGQKNPILLIPDLGNAGCIYPLYFRCHREGG